MNEIRDTMVQLAEARREANRLRAEMRAARERLQEAERVEEHVSEQLNSLMRAQISVWAGEPLDTQVPTA